MSTPNPAIAHTRHDRRRVLSQAQREHIRRKRQSGYAVRLLADRYDVSVDTIRRVCGYVGKAIPWRERYDKARHTAHMRSYRAHLRTLKNNSKKTLDAVGIVAL